MRILLVEDHDDVAEWLARALRQSGYIVERLSRGDDADHMLLTQVYDLIILDLSLPGLDGLEVLRRYRQREGRSPVLVLTARSSTEERVRGLNLGADDYLPKPFELAELEARIKALLRRAGGHAQVIRVARLSFDTATRQTLVDDQVLSLTPRELAVLEALLVRVGRPIAREQLFATVFGYDEEAREEAIEIYVHRLRKKLEGSGVAITTLRGLGYVLGEVRA
jgi:two-component system, OmpR family, response regulator TctD